MLDDQTGIRHVMMTADAVGGVWGYAVELASSLVALGARTTLVTMGGALPREHRAEVSRIPGCKLIESAFKLEWMEEPWEDVSTAGDWLLGLEERECPDIVHLNGYALGALNWHAPRVVVAHSCLLSWWRGVTGERQSAKYERYRYAVASGLRAADAVVVPTREMLRSLRDHYRAPTRARVIPGGVSTAGLSAAPKEPLVLAAGRLWDEAKNLTALAAVAPRLQWPVYLAGSEEPAGATRRYEGLHMLGWLERQALRDWMSRASIYVLPARYEPFGLSVLEAALSGCALVLGDIPTLRELWQDDAVFVPADDEAALLEAVQELIRDDVWRRGLGRAARARAQTCFGADRMGRSYLDLYRELVATRAAGLSPAAFAAG
jgi:glycosyltransferase involved in cell wall biosynthesis